MVKGVIKMVCEKCNAELQDGVKFCTNCGNKIENESLENKNNDSNVAFEKSIPDVKTKKKVQPKKYWLFLGAFVVVVLGAIIISVIANNSSEQSFDEDYLNYDDTVDYELNDDTQQLSDYETEEDFNSGNIEPDSDKVVSSFKVALSSNNGAVIYDTLIDVMMADVDLDIIDNLLVEKYKEIMKDLDAHDFTDEARQYGQDAVDKYLSEKYEGLVYPTFEDEECLIDVIFVHSERLPKVWQFVDETFELFIGCVTNECEVIYQKNEGSDGYTGSGLTKYYLMMYHYAEEIKNEKYMNMAIEGYKEICEEYLEFQHKELETCLSQCDYIGASEVYSDARYQMLETGLIIEDDLPPEIKVVAESVFEKYAEEFSSRAIDQAHFGNNMDIAKVYLQIACDLDPDNETYKSDYKKYFG